MILCVNLAVQCYNWIKFRNFWNRGTFLKTLPVFSTEQIARILIRLMLILNAWLVLESVYFLTWSFPHKQILHPVNKIHVSQFLA